MSDQLIVWIFLSAVTYRTARFVALDVLIEGTRDKFANWLQAAPYHLWKFKVLDLIKCPWCLTIWTSFFACLFYYLVIDNWPGWFFPIMWLSVATGGMVFWRFIDPGEAEVVLKADDKK